MSQASVAECQVFCGNSAACAQVSCWSACAGIKKEALEDCKVYCGNSAAQCEGAGCGGPVSPNEACLSQCHDTPANCAYYCGFSCG